jgi:hypothetical protein
MTVLVLVAMALAAVMSVAGLAGRVGARLAERRAMDLRAEEAALRAVFELDGTRVGLERARSMGDRVEFASSRDGPWLADPAPAGMRCVRVRIGSGAARAEQLEVGRPQALRVEGSRLVYPDARTRFTARDTGTILPARSGGTVRAYRLVDTDHVASVGGGYLQGADHRAVMDTGYFVATVVE